MRRSQPSETPSLEKKSVGALVLVVGPSGAGKDSMMGLARETVGRDPRIHFARRIITRSSDDQTESHDCLSPEAFDKAEGQGAFLLSWRAHGLAYAIPALLTAVLDLGHVVVANASRTVIAEAERLACRIVVIHVTAPVDVLARRIASRGREPLAEIAARLARQPSLAASRAEVVEIVNDTSLEEAAAQFTQVLLHLADKARENVR